MIQRREKARSVSVTVKLRRAKPRAISFYGASTCFKHESSCNIHIVMMVYCCIVYNIYIEYIWTTMLRRSGVAFERVSCQAQVLRLVYRYHMQAKDE